MHEKNSKFIYCGGYRWVTGASVLRSKWAGSGGAANSDGSRWFIALRPVQAQPPKARCVYAPGTGQGSAGGNECYRSSFGDIRSVSSNHLTQETMAIFISLQMSPAAVITSDITSPTTRVTASGSTVTYSSASRRYSGEFKLCFNNRREWLVRFSDFVRILGNIYSSTPDCTNQSPAIIATNQS